MDSTRYKTTTTGERKINKYYKLPKLAKTETYMIKSNNKKVNPPPNKSSSSYHHHKLKEQEFKKVNGKNKCLSIPRV